MSYTWSFHSYSEEGINEIFGRAAPDAVAGFVEWIGSDMSGLDRFAEAPTLARKVLTQGLSYSGLSETTSKVLDAVVMTAFSTEGFPAELQIQHLSPDGIDPYSISELLQHCTSPPTVLPLLRSGRRFGDSTGSKCEYCLLDPAEIGMLINEAQQALFTAKSWSNPYVPKVIQECLVGPLEEARREQKHLYAHLS